MPPVQTKPSLSVPRALVFASVSLPIQAMAIAMAVYLPRHFASHLGVSLAAVGTAFFIVRSIDIPVDGVLGWAMDKTRTRLGRYRLWSILGAPVLMAGIYALFFAPEHVGLVYLVTWLLVLYCGNSMLDLSHRAWAAALAPRYNDRSRLFGILIAVGVLGSASVIAIPIINDARHVADSANVQMMGWFLLLLTPIAVALAVLTTPERIAPNAGGHEFKLADYAALLARPTFLRLILADLCLSFGPGWMAAIYLFYFTDSRGFTTGQASMLLAVYILAGIVGAPLIARIAVKISKHRAVMMTTTGYSLTLLTFMAIPKGNVPVGMLSLFVAGVFASGFNLLTRAMTADIADEVRLEQGRERAGLLYAMTTMTTKIAGAISIGSTFWVLELVGYKAGEGVSNSAAAIHNLELVYIIGPVVCVMLGGLCMIGYKLGSERHAEIRRQLDERDALYDEAAIIESVTQQPAVRTEPGAA
ncbi:MFS transporter [Phenylobacterium sp.]|uniref:MFS transporter n=1 Tax=Phenylobacterium sp. TaxID=1871053 RepID=UPI0035ADB633